MAFPIPEQNILYRGFTKKSYDTVTSAADTALTEDLNDPVPTRCFRVVLRAGVAHIIAGAAATGTIYLIPFNQKVQSTSGPYWLYRTLAALAVGTYPYATPNLKDQTIQEAQQTPFVLDENEVLRVHSDALGALATSRFNISYWYLEFERLG